MATRRFLVTANISVEVDDQLLEDVLTDEWRSRFYALLTPEDVAAHLAFNLVQGRQLRQLDGFADQPEDRGCVVLEIDEVREDADETHPELWRALAPLEREPGGRPFRRRAYNVLTGRQADAKITSPAELKRRSLASLRGIKQLGTQALRAMAKAGLLSDEATAALLPEAASP